MATVKFGYASSSNISFKGILDSGYTREEWDEMSDREKIEAEQELLNELVDIWEEDDE